MIVFRAARAADRNRLEAMHGACSLQSRIGRWHAPLRAIPARYLDDAVSGRPDHVCALAFAGDELVGFASAVHGAEGRWDLGVLVRDDRQRQGVGTGLIDQVVHAARVRGARSVGADLRPDRRFLLAVLARHGCVIARTDSDGIHAEVALAAASVGPAGFAGENLPDRSPGTLINS